MPGLSLKDIETLTSEELSELVATRVMGWTFAEEEHGGYGYGTHRVYRDQRGLKASEWWHPTFDSAQALQVAREMTKTHDFFLTCHNGDCWIAEFTRPSEGFRATAGSAELAICRAALLAVS